MISSARSRPVITIITPVFNEADNLLRYESAIRAELMSQADFDFRVLFVEDGSRDRSWEIISEISRRDGRFQGIRLSRNFGSHIGLSAGLHHASGDAVALLACDLQDPPETVLEFARKWRDGAHIVWGKRRTRADRAWRVAASKFFEWLTRRYAMPRGSQFTTGSFLLMDRKVLDCFLQFRERNRVTFALVAWTGFDQTTVAYDRRPRAAGVSSWKWHGMLKTAYDTFLAFSKLPFGIMTAVGALMFLLSIPLSVYLVGCYVTGNPQPGWTSIMLVLVMFFGLQFMLLSLLGEYLFRIFSEVVQRPLFFVSDRTAAVADEASGAPPLSRAG
jgi:glycosyltransferase involved in cell wall biosynthesis